VEPGGWSLNPERPIVIRASVLRDIAAHARDAWPNECCGLLIGDTHTIDAVHRARNLHHSPARYLVQPEDHFAAIRRARVRALEVVGAYHSHPGGRPRPSTVDRDEAQPAEFIYVIAGTRRIRRRRCRRAPLPRGWRTTPGMPSHEGIRLRGSSRRPFEISTAWVDGHWIAAWRLVQGNFVHVPFVRDT
jgi:proteasome lid subunit RPN8/RPN11